MFRFSIEKWEAWAPELHDEASWQNWALSPYCPYVRTDTIELPSIQFLPAMQRRRLSPLARMVFGCAWPLADRMPPMPMVFASRHGETTRSFELLRDLATQQTLSPTSFALSVHNAIAGQWSIIRKETQETIALAGAEDTLEHAIQEACLLINGGAPQVLVVVAEDPPPAAYAPWIDDVPFPYVIALRLSAGCDWQLEFCSPSRDQAAQTWPNPLNFLQHIILKTPAWSHAGSRLEWHWSRRVESPLAS